MRTATEALAIARTMINTGTYYLGTGDADSPPHGEYDCFGFAFCKCYGVKRHRPGFNDGDWATVSDDLNCNSAIEDARHKKELFSEVPSIPLIQPGDLLAYPTFRLKDHDGVWHTGAWHTYIGHICIVDWVPKNPRRYAELDVIQCHGPNGRSPGIVRTDGSIWDQHDAVWPLQQHRTAILRPIAGRN